MQNDDIVLNRDGSGGLSAFLLVDRIVQELGDRDLLDAGADQRVVEAIAMIAAVAKGGT